MPIVVERSDATTLAAASLTIERHRSSIALQMMGTTPVVVITALPLRLERDTLFREVDSEFGICLAVRLAGAAPALGILRRTDTGFREFWRTHVPALRPSLCHLQAEVEREAGVSVIWRLDDETFAEFVLGGWNRQHRLWYARLDILDEESAPLRIAYADQPGDSVPVQRYI